MDEGPDESTEGERLKAFITARWTRQQGGIRGLAEKIGTSPDTVYRWFKGDPIDTYFLQQLADTLDVRRFEIVAAMDGEEQVLPLNDQTRTAFLALMEEWADGRGLPKPRREQERGNGAA